jgi:NADPH:quinone reductase-like Zn-dependent oxidoreductase
MLLQVNGRSFMVRLAELARPCCNLVVWQVWKCMAPHHCRPIRSYLILGATPIDYEKSDFVEEIYRLTDDGVDIVFDGVGEANVWRSFKALRPGGRVIAYGFTSFLQKGQLAGGLRYRLRGILRPAWYALRAFLSPGRRRILPYSIQYLKRWKPTWFREDLSALLALLRDKKIKPMIAELIPLSEARRAQELLGQGSVRGKLVLVCNSPWP